MTNTDHENHMQSTATTVGEYLNELPAQRRAVIEAVRAMILDNLPTGYQEGMQYGMIGYFVPHSLYPAGYHVNPKIPLPFAALAAQKNYCSFYFMPAYGDPTVEQAIRAAFKTADLKLDMGKSCIRFKTAADLPLEALGTIVASIPVKKYVARIDAVVNEGKGRNGR